MKCPCINKIFDLSVSAAGPTRMVIEDQSVWTDEISDSSVLSIQVSVKSLTAGGMVNTIPLAVNKRNILTAKDLSVGEEGECIEDGLYCFSIGPEGPGACGRLMSINRAFLPNAKCALQSLIANARDENDEKNYKRVEWLIEAIEAQTELDRPEEAKATYKVLHDLLKVLNCDCCK